MARRLRAATILAAGAILGVGHASVAAAASRASLAAMDRAWARHARAVGATRLARVVEREAERLAHGKSGRALVLPVKSGPSGTQGAVLAGTGLRSQVVHGLHNTFTETDPLAAHYPGGELPSAPPAWRELGPHAIFTSAAAEFNGPHARYRIAFNLSHFGGAPVNIGRFSGSHGDDLALSDHFAYVDGGRYAGEVDVYFGGRPIDPRRRNPDLVLYGDQANAKFGISIASAGDVNGDGWPDLLIGAAFHTTDVPNGGRIYLVYGGYLQQFRGTVKVRAQDIGRTIPGMVFDGGSDGRLYATWANELDGGDFDGDGLSDVLIGAYDPYPVAGGTTGARAYLVFGGRSLPLYRRRIHLGGARGLRSLVFEDPDPAATNTSLGWSAQFVGDVAGTGRDALAFTAGLAGPDRAGEAYIFTRRLVAPAPVVDVAAADTIVRADTLGGLRFRGLESARPAGDVNGDGRPDVLLTARDTVEDGTGPVGAAGVLFGRPTLPAQLGFSGLDRIFYGAERGQIGQPASDHGADFDGDGRAEVLLDDPYYLEPLSGQLQERGRMWLLRDTGAQVTAVQPSAWRTLVADTSLPGLFGYTWDTGDFDGDGRPDLVVGDHYLGDRDLTVHAGAAYLYPNAAITR